MAHGYHPHRSLPTRAYPEELTSTTKHFTAESGVSIELVAYGIRYFEDGEEHRKVTGYSALLDNGDGITATVYLNEEGDETPQTFSELDAYPEFRGGSLDDAWQEVAERRTELAQAFEDAIPELAGELTGR